MKKHVSDKKIGAAIIGCGLIGRKRAQALGSAHLVACADKVRERAESLACLSKNVMVTTDWHTVITRSDVDVLIVATTNNTLAEITTAAIRAGKHVLVEKPAACSTRELDDAISALQGAKVQVRVGFNHCYHPAMQKAHDLFSSGELGELMFIRGHYGHGGRIGYEKEWRANPVLSGGGEMIDQGVHLIDLARWFMGDFSEVTGFAHNYFWQMPVEDNGFMLLKNQRQQVAFLHVSCTEWKNHFSFEIYGRNAKLHVQGLGGSYGIERLAYYKMLPQMGPPETTIWEYPHNDNSWGLEFAEFLEDIRLGRSPRATLADARAALTVVEKICMESGYDYHA